MFDLAWSEILLIAVVAVVFIGPKELPAALRTFGKWMQKARQMAGEFQRNLDDMVREAELEDVKKQFDEVRGLATNPTGAIEKWVDPKGEIRGAFAAPESGTTYDKPGLEKPLDKPAIDPPSATDVAAAPASAPAQPVAAPVPVLPVAEPVPQPAQAASAQSAPPPVVTPPPAGAGSAAAEPSPSSAGAKAPAIAP